MKVKTVKLILSIPASMAIMVFGMWIMALGIHGVHIFTSDSVRDTFLFLISFFGICFAALLTCFAWLLPVFASN